MTCKHGRNANADISKNIKTLFQESKAGMLFDKNKTKENIYRRWLSMHTRRSDIKTFQQLISVTATYCIIIEPKL